VKSFVWRCLVASLSTDTIPSPHIYPPRATPIGLTAGTVEFLLDTQNPGSFYFCEMNTRLQVEHPITEEITGVDLVEWQLRVAAGEVLPITDSNAIPCRGHAFEARIYAENPARNFLPATGKVWHHAPPAPINEGLSSEGIRVDTCIQSGMDVSVYYDPMISKLIVHGEDRAQALQKLVSALKNYQIAGLPSNVDFLIKCAEHPVFGKAGAINTGFLEDYANDVKVFENETPPALAQAVGAFAAMMHLERRRGQVPVSKAPWSSHQGSWRMGGRSGRATRLLHLDGEASGSILCIGNTDGSIDVEIDGGGNVYHISGSFGTDTTMEVIVNHTQRIQLTTALKEDQNAIHVCMWPQKLPDHMWEVVLKHPYAPSTSDSTAAVAGEGSVKAPMPGRISRLEKQVGDTVEEGDVVLVIEAMKMEHGIRAPIAGVLSEIHYKENDIVADGAVLLTVDDAVEEAA
jgi:3-methylcrotonyl-CoA carboxylase alpha subunit